MRKTEKEYEEEIENLRDLKKELIAYTEQITLTLLPQKEKEILDKREEVRLKKEEIKKVTKTIREELRNLERDFRTLQKEKRALKSERIQIKKEILSIPKKISYRERLIGIQKNFNPSRRD